MAMHASAKPEIIAPDILMLAYRSGVFPMADRRDAPDVFWVEPRERAIIPPETFHLSRSLARTLRRERFTVTCNQAFCDVVENCAVARGRDKDESWISHVIQASYENLHRLGHAHSIECWQTDDDGARRLVGGLYGVGFDQVFCGESMFSYANDASKVALAWLVAIIRRAGVRLLDCQFMTSHLKSLGAVEISQADYVNRLAAAQQPHSADVAALSLPEGFAALRDDAAVAGLASSPGKFIAHFLTQTS